MQSYILEEVLKLQKKVYVDPQILEKFITRIKNDPKLIQQDNPQDHLCSLFVPVDLQTKSIYLVHHKKADDWIPPGGHIEVNETPIETIKREFYEELKYKLVNENISLFNLSIKTIKNAKQTCKVHYDFWYLIYINKYKFSFDKKEFHDAGWFTLKKAVKLIKTKNYNLIIKSLPQLTTL